MSGAHHASALSGPEGTREGLRAIWISAAALGTTTVLQFVLVGLGGSAGLLADALDNLGDVITTFGLAIAFLAARRAADRRYTFGYQRFEDLAGVFVLLVIWGSAALSGWQSYSKLAAGHEVGFLGASMGAALAGAVGNEFVARYKIRIGRRIGSEALVADGRHARTDALASVAAFGGLLGSALGWKAADPVAGFTITIAIVAIAWDASRHVLARLLDAVDPALVRRIVEEAGGTEGVASVGRCQARWAGRSLYVTITVAVDGHEPLARAHEVAEAVHHDILHHLPEVAQVDVHVDPWEPHAAEAHARTAAHDAREGRGDPHAEPHGERRHGERRGHSH